MEAIDGGITMPLPDRVHSVHIYKLQYSSPPGQKASRNVAESELVQPLAFVGLPQGTKADTSIPPPPLTENLRTR